MRKSGSGFDFVATAGTIATASSMRRPFGSAGSSGTESLPQRASVELDLDAMLPRKTADGGTARRP